MGTIVTVLLISLSIVLIFSVILGSIALVNTINNMIEDPSGKLHGGKDNEQ